MKRKERPGIWIAIGIGTGTALGVALDNIAVGIGLGAAIGYLVFYMNSRHNKR